MDLVIVAQQVANGLANGMAYVLIATGLTLVFGVLRMVNFAHGEFYMIGAFATYYCISLTGMGYLPALVIATLAGAALGLLANALLFWPLRGQHEFTILLVSLGLAQFLAASAEEFFGAEPKYVASPFADEMVEMGQIVITQQRVLILLLSLVVLVALALFIRRSRMGRMMRATAQNPQGALLTGINVRQVYMFTFALSCGLAALAGALIGPTTMIFPHIGNWAVLKGFIVVVIGGLGSVPGALIAGLGLGVIEALVGGFISLGFAEAVGYAAIILVLLFRPAGLFGNARRA